MNRDDLKGRLPIVYNGKTVEEWYSLFCQQTARKISQRKVIDEVTTELEVIAETIMFASDLQILADRGMYAEGIKRQAAKLRGETDE